jgi:hypothetical protein
MKRELFTSTKGRLSIVSVVAILAVLAFSAAASARTAGQVSHPSRHPHTVQSEKRAVKRSPNSPVSAAVKKAAAKKAAAKKLAEKKAAAKKAAAALAARKRHPVKPVAKPATPAATPVSYGTVTTLSNGTVVASTGASAAATTLATTAGSAAVTPSAPAPSTPVTSPTTSTATPAPGSVTAPANGSILWGAATGTQFDNGGQAPWDMNVVNDFQNQDAAGKGMSIIPFYDDFLNCPNSSAGAVDGTCSTESFPWTPFNDIRAHGSIPMLSWGSQTLQDGYANTATDSNFTLAKVAAGDYDSYITSWAQKAASWGHPFFMRFNWEMNGDWFPWSVGSNGNTAASYVAAWRHVHDIFVKNGATNATWVWCPNAGYSTQLAALYPGDAYVDWTCMDAYNFGTDSGNTWKSFDQVAGPDYAQITQSIAPSKPMMLGEFNSSNDGGSRASWLTTTMAEIPVKYPAIKAVVAFDSDSDFTLETDPASVSAFSNAINNPVFASNSFGNLSGGAIAAQ